MISATNYTKRRDALASAAKQPLIVISGGDLIQSSSDSAYPFEQDGNFYLTGIDEPGWMLVIDVQRGEEFLVSTNESDYHSGVWDDVTSHSDLAKISGVKDVKNRREGWTYIRTQCEGYQSIGSIVPKLRYTKFYGMYINPAKILLVERLKKAHRDANIVDISEHIRNLRTIKDSDEIEAIREAVALTGEGFKLVQSKLDSYRNESEIELDFWNTFRPRGADWSYTPIVASGRKSAIIHSTKNTSDITSNSFILMDVGARLNHYCGDITRTYAIGEVSERHKQVYEEVQAAQAESLAFLKPGVTMREHEGFIEQKIGESLTRLGVIDTMLRKNIRKYYPHGISHHLGIDVHDSCSYDRPLVPGVVITVEPGIYLPDESVGVRIEDNILITETGIEVLSKDIE